MIDISGFPTTACGNANFEIARLACISGGAQDQACAAATPLVKDICCTESAGISAGAIVGVVAGSLFLLALGFVAYRMMRSKSSTSKDTNYSETNASNEDGLELDVV